MLSDPRHYQRLQHAFNRTIQAGSVLAGLQMSGLLSVHHRLDEAADLLGFLIEEEGRFRLAVMADAIEQADSVEDAEEDRPYVHVDSDQDDLLPLLTEWYRWWETTDTAPPKMPDGLHVRTVLALFKAGALDQEFGW